MIRIFIMISMFLTLKTNPLLTFAVSKSHKPRGEEMPQVKKTG